MFRYTFVALLAFSTSCEMSAFAQSPACTRAATLLIGMHETIAYSDASFISRMHAAGLTEGSENIMKLPFVELMGGLASLDEDTARDVERRYSGFIVGASDFVAPEGLGAVRSRTSYIGIIASGEQPDIGSDFSLAAQTAIAGRQAWTWSAPPYEGHSQPTVFYAAQIGSSYFLMTDNRADFANLAQALSSPALLNLQAPKVFSWENFSSHQYWIYRRFRRGSGVTDAAGMTNLTNDVDVLTFSADFDNRLSAIRVHSNDAAMSNAPKVLPDTELGRFRQAGSGVWEASVPLTDDAAGRKSMVRLFYTFGFGLIL